MRTTAVHGRDDDFRRAANTGPEGLHPGFAVGAEASVDTTLLRNILIGLISLAFILFLIRTLIGGDNLNPEPAVNATKDIIRLPR